MQYFHRPNFSSFPFYPLYYKIGASHTNTFPPKFVPIKDQSTVKPFTNSCYSSSSFHFSCRLHSCPWCHFYPLCSHSTCSCLPFIYFHCFFHQKHYTTTPDVPTLTMGTQSMWDLWWTKWHWD